MQNRAAGIRKREGVVVQGEGTEGMPVLGKEQTQQVVGDEFVDATVTRLTCCGGCGAVLHSAEEVGGICAICRCALCAKACAPAKCGRCGRCVCSADSERVGDEIVCAECLATLARSGWVLLLVIIAAMAVILILIRNL